MKALVLAGGRGSRIGNISESINKTMIQVDRKPIIEYSFDNISHTDIAEIVVVVGYRSDDIINYFGSSFKNKKINYVFQETQKGLVNGIECARKEIGNDDFMLLLGDEILIKAQHKNMLEKFKQESIFCLCGTVETKETEDIKKNYTIKHDRNNKILEVIEKPKILLSNLIGTGNCIFKNEIFNYIDRTPINKIRQQKELPDLIQCVINDNQPVYLFDIASQYLNINTHKDIDLVEKLLKCDRN